MADVTVLIPTVGRIGHLKQCFDALRCGTRIPEDLVVVAQGAHDEIIALTEVFPELPIRVIRDDGRGRGRALNVGIAGIDGGVVLITDDDCRVREDWVDRGVRGLLLRPGALVTGRVLTCGDLSRVPALRLDPIARDYVGRAGFGKLTGGNIAVRVSDLKELGGFDERIVPACEDNDFCWRWLKAGRTVHYDPEMVIWHDDWRDDQQLRAVFRSYGHGQGRFYAKHLAARDPWIALYVTRDLVAGIRMVVRTLARRRSLRSDVHLAFFPALVKAMLTFGRTPRDMPAAPAATAQPQSAAPGSRTTVGPVGVIITTKDRRDHVIEAVASVLAQTVETDVIVMDDGSTDGTRAALVARFPGLRVERSDRSMGPCPQRNRAMEFVNAELVFMMDDDAYLPSSRTVEQTLAEFDEPRVAVATIPYRNARRESFLRQEAPGVAGSYAVGVFVGVGAVFRREAFLAVGGYERGVGIRGEEGDLALRLIAAGFVVVASRADPLVHWEYRPRKDSSAFLLSARNEVLLTALRVPRRHLPGRLAVVVARAITHGLLKRHPRPAVRGLIAGTAEAWERRRERRPVPLWAYQLTRSLRKNGPLPMNQVLDAVRLHQPGPVRTP